MKLRHLLAVFAALALFAGACSSDSEESTDGSGDDASGDTAAETDAPDASESIPSIDQDDLDAGESAFDAVAPDECEFLFDLSTAIPLAMSGQVDASEFSADEAPDEIRDDVETFLSIVEEFNGPDGASSQALNSTEFQQAADNIGTYVEQNCEPAG